MEIQRYLKAGSEFDLGKEVIQRIYSCEYVSLWSSLLIRIEIIRERRIVSINLKSYATLWILGDWKDSI